MVDEHKRNERLETILSNIEVALDKPTVVQLSYQFWNEFNLWQYEGFKLTETVLARRSSTHYSSRFEDALVKYEDRMRRNNGGSV